MAVEMRAGSKCLVSSSAVSVQRLVAEIVPLVFVREYGVSVFFSTNLGAVHQAAAPFVRAPQKLRILVGRRSGK